MYEYRIGRIIPESIARNYEKELLNKNITEKDLEEIIIDSKLWSNEPYFELPYFELEGNKAFKLETENAFGNWIIFRYPYYSNFFLWNSSTLEKQIINIFELYVIVNEFQINKYNSLNLDNPEDDIVVKEGKVYINGKFIKELLPLEKINYNFENN